MRATATKTNATVVILLFICCTPPGMSCEPVVGEAGHGHVGVGRTAVSGHAEEWYLAAERDGEMRKRSA
jgi:hypothetical protein